jgi:hypothetical protein
LFERNWATCIVGRDAHEASDPARGLVEELVLAHLRGLEQPGDDTAIDVVASDPRRQQLGQCMLTAQREELMGAAVGQFIGRELGVFYGDRIIEVRDRIDAAIDHAPALARPKHRRAHVGLVTGLGEARTHETDGAREHEWHARSCSHQARC